MQLSKVVSPSHVGPNAEIQEYIYFQTQSGIIFYNQVLKDEFSEG